MDREKLAKVYELVKELEKEADVMGESFDLDIAWGMGGTYIPNKGWAPSSQSC